MLGLRDYVNKNRFPGVLLGLSGGIDSALTAAVAVDALGPSASAASACRRGSPVRTARTMPTVEARAPRHARSIPSRLATSVEAVERTLAPLFAGREPRPHRREHPGARARTAADGGVEQVRLDAADHRQQVGDVGRLRDALRRHVRRLLGAQGSLQDRGLRARRVAQPLRAGGRARAGGRSDSAESS